MTTLVRRDTSGSGFVILAIVIAAGLGALTAISPLLGVGAGLAAFVTWLLSYGKRMIPVFHVGLVIILIGYAFLGKGMAYVGVAPIYIGEMVLVLALLAIAVSLSRRALAPVPPGPLAFMAWGLIRTVPYIGLYDIDALRDGVSWGYGVFAVAVSLTVRRERIEPAAAPLRPLHPMVRLLGPDRGDPVRHRGGHHADGAGLGPCRSSSFKAGDAGRAPRGDRGVHGPRAPAVHGRRRQGLGHLGRLADRLGISGAISRGGLLAAAMMATSIVFARNGARWVSLVLVGLFLFAVIGLANPRGRCRAATQALVRSGRRERGQRGRRPQGRPGPRGHEGRGGCAGGTKIVDYTVDGPYFWYGKGFGVNLADADGFQVNADGSLRAPHNGHLELLARGGVPMLALWILVQVAFGITMLRAALRAHAAGLDRLLKVPAGSSRTGSPRW